MRYNMTDCILTLLQAHHYLPTPHPPTHPLHPPDNRTTMYMTGASAAYHRVSAASQKQQCLQVAQSGELPSGLVDQNRSL